ncbi:MAG: alanine--tRNA ligase, partial [Alphaproteobacteria bacterium]|nr:alanine--tRNA ligase [Alphaproteobacteria bacterium]
TNFKQTLERGLRLLDEEEAKLGAGQDFPGEIAFRLYDTYGFPLDLTEDVLRVRNRRVAHAGFDAAMARQREEARKSWVGSGEAATGASWLALREELGPTEFLGYETETAAGIVLALLKGGERVAVAQAGDEIALVVNQTPFYGESGGQVGDTGSIFSPSGGELAVRDTAREAGDLFVHLGTVAHGELKVGDSVELRVDGERRRRLRANHSVTHLLHQALRHRLGEHVTQKGSLVAPDRLRFDFSQPRPLGHDDIAAIEAEVNARIRANSEVRTRLLSPDKAIEEGAMALFGEKYGDEVRVVSMGAHDHEEHPWSVELCGGTHVRRTGDIGLFKVVGEGSVASGVRRIEALTGAAAEAYVAGEEDVLQQAAGALKTSPAELPARVARLVDEQRRLERELAELRRALAGAAAGHAAAPAAAKIGDVAFDGRVVDDVPGRELRSLADDLKRKIGSGVVAVVARDDGKAAIVVGVTSDLTPRLDAVGLVRAGAEILGGKGGGGRPDMAQAGGPDAARAEEALDAVRRALAAQAGH